MISPLKVLVIIPALNEEATIGRVLRDLNKIGLEQIRVVDNGSSDGTPLQAKGAGAEVVFEPRAGYGQACWTGLQSLPASITWILFCDADGSDDPADIPRLLAAVQSADFVLGNRRATLEGRNAMTPVQNFGNWLSTLLIRLIWGYRYQDLGPLRLIRREALEHMAMQDRGFGWTIEMQIRAIEAGLRILELPVNYRPRLGGKSKISGTLRGSFKAGVIILGTIARAAMARRRKGAC